MTDRTKYAISCDGSVPEFFETVSVPVLAQSVLGRGSIFLNKFGAGSNLVSRTNSKP